jgi:hypothetical protein
MIVPACIHTISVPSANSAQYRESLLGLVSTSEEAWSSRSRLIM